MKISYIERLSNKSFKQECLVAVYHIIGGVCLKILVKNNVNSLYE